MGIEKNDFEFICSLASAFFGRPHLKKRLIAISEEKMTGWEKWLQIEFATFVRDHPDIKAWWRESKYQLDGRLLSSRSKCAVDFLVHQRHKQSHMAIELKQMNSADRCIGAMLKDIVKIGTIKKATFDIRTVWCIGVHHVEDPAEVYRLIKYKADKMNIDIDQNLVKTLKIGRTQYSFTIM